MYKVKDSTGYVAQIHGEDILRHQIDFTQYIQVNNNLKHQIDFTQYIQVNNNLKVRRVSVCSQLCHYLDM